MDVLERLLFDLRSSTEQNDSVLTPIIIVENIAAHAFGEEMGDVDQGFVSHLLFQSESPPSLLIFLRDTPHSKDNAEVTKAKAAALKFLARYIKVTESIEQFALLAFETFYNCFVQEESSTVKVACLLPLNNILRRCEQAHSHDDLSCDASGRFDDLGRILQPDEMNLTIVFSMFLKELQANKRISKGIKCELFKILGLIIGAYSTCECVSSKIGAVVDLCLYELKKNFSVNCGDLQLSTIAGCFSCLDRCLFLPPIKLRLKNNSELWEYLLKAVSAVSSNDLTRYAAASKALRLVKHHSKLFQILIGRNSVQTYKAIEQCHVTGKKSVLKHSEDALYSILIEMASAAIDENIGTKETKIMIQNLLHKFLKILTTPHVSEKETMIAVKGIAALSSSINLLDLSTTGTFLDLSATRTFLQKDDRKNVMNEVNGDQRNIVVFSVILALIKSADLSPKGEGLGEGSQSDVLNSATTEDIIRLNNDTVNRVSSHLHAVSNIIFASVEYLHLTQEIMAYLKSASVDIIVAYPRLRPKQQLMMRKALTLLLHGLSAIDRFRNDDQIFDKCNNQYRGTYNGTNNNNNNNNKNNCNNDSNNNNNINNKNNHNNDSNDNDNNNSNKSDYIKNNDNGSIRGNSNNSGTKSGINGSSIEKNSMDFSIAMSAPPSLLSQYLDDIIPALLLHSMSRSLPGEDIIIDPALLQILNEQLRNEKLEGLSNSDIGDNSSLGNRMIPAYFILWCDIFTPTDLEMIEKIAKLNIVIKNKDKFKIKREFLGYHEKIKRIENNDRNDAVDGDGGNDSCKNNTRNDNDSNNENNYNNNNNDSTNAFNKYEDAYKIELKIAIYDKLMLEILKYLRRLDLSYLDRSSLDRQMKQQSSERESNQIKTESKLKLKLKPVGGISNESQSQFNVLEHLDGVGEEEGDIEEEEAEEEGNDNTSTDKIIPNNLIDQDILINLVIFLELFLPHNAVHRLIAWYTVLCDECLELSRSYPLVSAFYRLILCLSSAVVVLPSFHFDLLHYLEEDSLLDSNNILQSSSSSVKDRLLPDTTSTCNSSNRFLSPASNINFKKIEITVMNVRSFLINLQNSQIKHYHDELLSTSLIILLCIPSIFIPFEILLCSIELALKSGVQVFHAVKAIQKAVALHSSINENENQENNVIFDKSLDTLLPLLDQYLMVGNHDKKNNGQINLEKIGSKGTSQMKKMKDLFRYDDFDNSVYCNERESRIQDCTERRADNNNDDSSNNDNNNNKNNDNNSSSTYSNNKPTRTGICIQDIVEWDRNENENKREGDGDIQYSIIRLLGRLGGRNQKLLRDPIHSVSSTLTWIGSTCLTISLPLPKFKVDSELKQKLHQMSSSLHKSNPISTSSSSSSSSSLSNLKSHLDSLPIVLDKLLPRIVELCSSQSQTGSNVTPLGSTSRQGRDTV